MEEESDVRRLAYFIPFFFLSLKLHISSICCTHTCPSSPSSFLIHIPFWHHCTMDKTSSSKPLLNSYTILEKRKYNTRYFFLILEFIKSNHLPSINEFFSLKIYFVGLRTCLTTSRKRFQIKIAFNYLYCFTFKL